MLLEPFVNELLTIANSPPLENGSSVFETLESCNRRVVSMRKAARLIEKASWSHAASSLSLQINLNARQHGAFPCLEMLHVFFPGALEQAPYFYTDAEASPILVEAVSSLNAQEQSAGQTALSLLHAIESAITSSCASHALPNESQSRQQAETRVQLKVKADARSCDLLLSVFWAAASSNKRNSLVQPFPPGFSSNQMEKDFDGLLQVLLSCTASPADQSRCQSSQSVLLLDWLFNRLPVTLESQTDQILQEQVESFGHGKDKPRWIASVIQSEDPYFSRMVNEHGSSVCFHGSSVENIFSILQNGLRNMSGTSKMTSGAAFGDGIYLAESVQVAKQFAPFGVTSWSTNGLTRSAQATVQCVLLCEAVKLQEHFVGDQKTTGANYFVVQDERLVRVKALAVFGDINTKISQTRTIGGASSSIGPQLREMLWYLLGVVCIVIFAWLVLVRR